jgi:hypothetical protein
VPARRPSPAQPAGDCLADVAGQRQPVGAPALAAHHQLAGWPVDVIKGERGDLPTPKPSRTSKITIA